jgi:threonylcarbamoyladenosine tRNA methylthiotransferase MtaB
VSVEVVSLGCRMNLSESETLRGLLAGSDDLVVINSCAVTAEAVRQTRQAIRRARKARPDARLLVTGCAAEIERAALAAMPEVDGLVSNHAKLDPRLYSRTMHSSPLAGEDTKARSRSDLAAVGEGGNEALPRPPLQASLAPKGQAALSSPARGEEQGNPHLHTRAFIAVQNGCDHSCTFCIIPQGRGASRSQPIPIVLADIGCHVEAGLREVVLTGVDLTSWGHDLPGSPRLGALVAAILDEFPALPRLRLSSLDGIEIDEQLFEIIASEARVMPHLHLSLQSGDDLILKRMKRRHSRRDALDLVTALRARRPDIAVGADLIAGFPTESDAAHAQNLAIIRELGVVHGHIFPYSPRPGTPAARMPQVDGQTIKRRAAELRAAVAEERNSWLSSHIGQSLEILAERDGTGHAPGFARVQLPEGTPAGSLVTVTPSRIIEGLLA